MKYFSFLFIVSLLVSGCSFSKSPKKNDLSDVVIPDVDHEYFEVDYITINWSDILKQNKPTYYVYIYSLTCSHCQEIKNWIISEALNRDNIFFAKGTNATTVLTDVSSTIGATSIEEIAILGYPTMLKIENKTLVENVAGKTNIIALFK